MTNHTETLTNAIENLYEAMKTIEDIRDIARERTNSDYDYRGTSFQADIALNAINALKNETEKLLENEYEISASLE